MVNFFNYFQILCLVILAYVVVSKTIHFRLRKINPIAIGKGKGGLHKFIEFSFIVVYAFWIAEVIIYSLNIKTRLLPSFFHIELVNSLSMKIIGSVLLCLGVFMFVWAFLSFGYSWRVGIDKNNPGKLVRGGIFTLSRNPIFTGFDIYYTGTFLINGTIIFLIITIFMVLNLHYQILQEEKFLMETYKQEYKDYCSSVKRYFTWRRLTGKL